MASVWTDVEGEKQAWGGLIDGEMRKAGSRIF